MKDLGYVHDDMTDHLNGLGYVALVSGWYPVEGYGRRHRLRSLRRRDRRRYRVGMEGGMR